MDYASQRLDGLASTFLNLSIPSIFFRIILTVGFLYYSSFLYNFVRNSYTSRSTGLPSVFIPWDQNSIFWIIASVPARPWLKKNFPTWLANRLSLMTYNWEYLDRLRVFHQLEAQGKPSHTFQFVTCGRFEVWTRDREVAAEVLGRPDDFLVFEFSRIFLEKLGVNVLTSDNPVWKRHRKVVGTVLNEKISASVFSESLKQTDGMLNELFGPNGRTGDTTITTRAFDMMKKITIHVLSGAGMGVSTSWHDDANENPKPCSKMTYIQALKIIVECMAGTMALPVSVLNNWPSFLPGASLFHKLGLALEELARHTNDMLEERRLQKKAPNREKIDILTQLVEASQEGTTVSNKYGTLSQQEMSGNLFIFTVAGFETTANTLSYALVLAARYPQWQEWLIQEVDSLIQEGTESAQWNYNDIYPQAKRTLAFMYETVRLQPPVVHEIKSVPFEQTISVSHGTYKIPANTSLYINNVALHLDPEVWRDLNQPKPESGAPEAEDSPWRAEDGPGDEARFRPTRWFDSDTGAFFQPPRGAFLPWSMGPRVCPGQKMAQVEFVTILLRLLAICRIEPVLLDVIDNGITRKETRQELNARLDKHVRSSTALLALQMDGVYNVDENKGDGLKLKLTRRSRS